MVSLELSRPKRGHLPEVNHQPPGSAGGTAEELEVGGTAWLNKAT